MAASAGRETPETRNAAKSRTARQQALDQAVVAMPPSNQELAPSGLDAPPQSFREKIRALVGQRKQHAASEDVRQWLDEQFQRDAEVVVADHSDDEEEEAMTNIAFTPALSRLELPGLPEDWPARTAQRPSAHVVKDSWYDKVGAPEAKAAGDPGAAAAEPPIHLMQAHRDSFLFFLSHGFGRQMAAAQAVAKLSSDSTVIISRQEARDKLVNIVEVAWPKKAFGATWDARDGEDARPAGAASVQLGSVQAEGVHERFTVQLMTEQMYFKTSSATRDMIVHEGGSYMGTAFLPAKVCDGATGFTFDTHIEVGSFPMMFDNSSFVVNGNPYIFVHRLCKSPAPYFKVEDAQLSLQPRDLAKTGELPTKIHTLELVTLEYSRMRICSMKGKASIKIPGSKISLPAAPFLLAMGLTKTQILQARNGASILSDLDVGNDTLEGACEKLGKLMDLRTEWFKGDHVATFNMKTRWLTTSRIGLLGRRRFNERLGLNLDDEMLTKFDVLAAVDLAIDSDLGARTLQADDIDSLVNKRLRSAGEVMEMLVKLWLKTMEEKCGCLPLHVNAVTGTASVRTQDTTIKDLYTFIVSQIWAENNRQLCDEVNALAELSQGRRISQVSELGLDKIKRIQGIRLIHSTHYGRVCPIETGEGMSAGITMTMSCYTKTTLDGEMEAPYQRVVRGRRLLKQPWDWLLSAEDAARRVAQFDIAHREDGQLCLPARPKRGGAVEDLTPESWQTPETVTMTHLGLFGACPPERVEYVACGPPTSVAVNHIPFLEHDDANRAQMGAKMQQQAVPCMWPERPVVGTGFEAHAANSSGWRTCAGLDGQVLYADGQSVVVISGTGVEETEDRRCTLEAHLGEMSSEDAENVQGIQWYENVTRSARIAHTELPLAEGWEETPFSIRAEVAKHAVVDAAATKKHILAHDTTIVEAGDLVCSNESVAERSGIAGGEVAVGKNLVVAYMPFDGYNYEDAIVLSARLVREDIFTSVHVDEIVQELWLADTPFTPKVVCDDGEERELDYMESGLVKEGTYVEPGDVMIACLRKESSKIDPTLTDEVFKSWTVPEGVSGRVISSCWTNTYVFSEDMGHSVVALVAKIVIAIPCRIQVGDKLAGRHGNKGIVSIIVDDRDMPYLPDGTPIDVCLNPLGVPSRMNVGQIFENLLGSAGRWSGQEYRVGNFDEMFAEEASRGLVFDALRRAREQTGYSWLLDSASPGKTRVYDGRTGRALDQPVTAGVSYIIKLYHMVRDKIAFRSSGGYNVITQQPTKGRRRNGGQRLGEMEVSALVGHGASAVLQEMLTVKSDDLGARLDAEAAMARNEPVVLPSGGTSEGYLTFQRELAASGFSLTDGAILDSD